MPKELQQPTSTVDHSSAGRRRLARGAGPTAGTASGTATRREQGSERI
jgi:hypothetical protein